jgi:hypothetical protein
MGRRDNRNGGTARGGKQDRRGWCRQAGASLAEEQEAGFEEEEANVTR